MAAIRVSKEGKSALFETTIIQTTDNKYIYTMPVRVDNKLVNFEAKGLLKENIRGVSSSMEMPQSSQA